MAGYFHLDYFGSMQTIMDSATGTDARDLSAAAKPETGTCGNAATKSRCCRKLYELLGLDQNQPRRRCLLCPHKN